MIETHPAAPKMDVQMLAQCIEHCFECAQTCTACADACLGEQNVQMMTRCIRLNLDCASLCVATGSLLSRQTQPEWQVITSQVETLAMMCRICGDECEGHADKHEHCRICMESCRRCEESCNRLLQQTRALA